jgi:hypothetical protein
MSTPQDPPANSPAPPGDLDLLLPFHVNGTLTPAEQARMDAWLAEDAAAAAQAEGLARVRQDMQAEAPRSPGEFGLARLMRDVRQEQAAATSAPSAAPRRPWLWQAVAALALAALLGQVIWPRPAADGRFELAGAGRDAGAALVVGFAASATEAQIRTLLVDLGLEIVAGPSAVGLYRLQGVDDTDPDAALRALQASPDIVESVAHDDD